MIVKTPAIVLRRHPYTETSQVITWLTPDAGRLNTLLKGAMRPKNPFLGHVDLFYTCELLYYDRAPDGLPVTREVAPLATRDALRRDWRACAIASYLCALVSRATPPQATRAEIYTWLSDALDDLARRGGAVEIMCLQELRLLRLLGLAPRLDRCLDCAAPAASADDVWFSSRDGGWRCDACSSAIQRAESSRVPPDALRLVAEWQRAATPDEAMRSTHRVSTIDAAQRLIGPFLSYHLEVTPAPRIAALDILARRPVRRVDRMPSLR